MTEDQIFESFLKTPMPLVKGSASTKDKSPRIAADANNPSGILVGKDESGRPIYKQYKSPEEGVSDTQNLVSNYLSGKGAMRGQKITPENIIGTWVNGDPTTGASVQGGKYLKTLQNELTSAGIQLNPDGSIPNTPEANAALTRTIITHESGNRAKYFLPHITNNLEKQAEQDFNLFLKPQPSGEPTVTISEPTAQQPSTDYLGNFAEAAGHHMIAPFHGIANLAEQGIATGLEKLMPNSEIAKLMRATANKDVEAIKEWERKLQAKYYL
jgi:hypothetical protein